MISPTICAATRISRKNNYGELVFLHAVLRTAGTLCWYFPMMWVHGKGFTLIGKMPGGTVESQGRTTGTAYAFMMGHPGKKLLFMEPGVHAQVSPGVERRRVPGGGAAGTTCP